MQFLKQLNLKKSIVGLSLLVVMIISCDTPIGHVKTSGNGRFPASVTAELFSKEEQEIGLRICYAFRLKRFQFEMEQNHSLVYENSHKSCDGKTENKRETFKIESMNQKLISSTTSGKKNAVQTEKSGWLSSICKSLMKGHDPESNIISYTDDEIKTVSFYRKDKYDGFKVHIKKYTDEGEWQKDKTLFFLISTYESDPHHGVVKSFGQVSPCPNDESQVAKSVSKLSHKETSLWAQSL